MNFFTQVESTINKEIAEVSVFFLNRNPSFTNLFGKSKRNFL